MVVEIVDNILYCLLLSLNAFCCCGLSQPIITQSLREVKHSGTVKKLAHLIVIHRFSPDYYKLSTGITYQNL